MNVAHKLVTERLCITHRTPNISEEGVQTSLKSVANVPETKSTVRVNE